MRLLDLVKDNIEDKDKATLALLDLEKTDDEIVQAFVDAKILDLDNIKSDEDKEI